MPTIGTGHEEHVVDLRRLQRRRRSAPRWHGVPGDARSSRAGPGNGGLDEPRPTAGRTGDAIEAFRSAIDILPRNLEAYANLGICLDESGRLEEVNLAHLFCGAEGTLGVVTRVVLRLRPLRRRRWQQWR